MRDWTFSRENDRAADVGAVITDTSLDMVGRGDARQGGGHVCSPTGGRPFEMTTAKKKRVHRCDRRLADQGASRIQAQGRSSLRRRLGQLLTSFVRMSVKYASGLLPCNLQVLISEASFAQFSAPSSDPAKRAFFLLRA